MISIKDTCRGLITGRPSIYSIPVQPGVTEDSVLAPSLQHTRQLVFSGPNLVCTGLYSAIQGLMSRNVSEWQAASVQVGYGGDYDQPADPDNQSPADQGERIGPVFTDAYVRKPIFSAPIRLATSSDVLSSYRWSYSAVISPFEALTDIGEPTHPFINEFGLLAANGELLAHFIPAADDLGRAERRQKSDLEWWVIVWDLEFVGSVPVE